MTAIVIVGILLVVLGLCGLGYCIRVGYKVRRAGLPPDATRAALGRLIGINFASVALAALGLMLVVVGGIF